MSPHHFTGALLVKNGLIDADTLARAKAVKAPKGTTLGRILAGLGVTDEPTVARALASALSLEFLDVDSPAAADVTALLSVEFCTKRNVLPLSATGNTIRLAVCDPLDYSIVQDVEFRTGKRATAVVVTQTWIELALAQRPAEQVPEPVYTYDPMDDIEPEGEVESAPEGEYELVDPATLAKDSELPPIVKLVNRILSEAARAGASDVHVEPHEGIVQVRQRVDGLLRDMIAVPTRMQDQMISRLKIISGMDITERRKPQDGRSRLRFEGRRIDLRVSTLPTQFGEKVVIRFLNPDSAILGMDQLGLSPENLTLVKGFLSRPQGMVLVTGPTGSGKTSTLYSTLASIKSPTNNIVTLEDPIEFQMPGINQTQINSKAGVTFASGLRSILRQDPNIVLVGEVRDRETAEIALQAAQTGHLLLTTLHTNDAPATITRLLDLGVQPFLIASSILGIVAQRLVRRPCRLCSVPAEPSAEVIEKLGGASKIPADGKWMAGPGCDACGNSGYKGRLAIHEVLPFNDELRSLVASQAQENAIRRAGRRAGMRTLLEDGIQKASLGLTTLEEILRVAPKDDPGADEALAATSGQAGAAESSSVDPATGARRRVLIVDDSPTIVSVVKYFLEIEGFEVIVAEDGDKGLETALREVPDLIVSDVNMPGMTGTQMVRALRRDPRTRQVRVLMLTSESGVDQEAEGLEAGADDYVLKPVEPRRLAARVKAVLGRSRPVTTGVPA